MMVYYTYRSVEVLQPVKIDNTNTRENRERGKSGKKVELMTVPPLELKLNMGGVHIASYFSP